MPQIALTTFLKLCLLPEKRKRSEYRRYLTPGGGYDFYWSLKDCISEVTFGDKTYDYCVGKILNPLKNVAERQNNTAGLQAFMNWLRPHERNFFQPPQGIASTPKGHLKIRLKPEFGIYSANQRRVVAVWNTKEPELTQFVAGVGTYLLQSNLSAPPFDNCAFTILDLRSGKWYISETPHPNVVKFVVSEFEWIDNFFEENKKKAAA